MSEERKVAVLKFAGSSDDTFGNTTNRNAYDSDDCGSLKPFQYKLTDPDGNGMYIIGQYAVNNASSTWMVGIAQLDEDVPLPPWTMKWGVGGRGYSVELEVHVPVGSWLEEVRCHFKGKETTDGSCQCCGTIR